MPRKLQAETQGKGTIIISLDQCRGCSTKACAGSCPVNLIKIEGELPAFSKPADQVKRLCMDCLACELECSLQGRGALRIVYRMPQLEEHLRKLEEKGVKAVWRRG
jgi:NAD-dependent dihydropyrimidine dehydrogenase PreA subunit